MKGLKTSPLREEAAMPATIEEHKIMDTRRASDRAIKKLGIQMSWAANPIMQSKGHMRARIRAMAIKRGEYKEAHNAR